MEWDYEFCILSIPELAYLHFFRILHLIIDC